MKRARMRDRRGAINQLSRMQEQGKFMIEWDAWNRLQDVLIEYNEEEILTSSRFL